MHLPTRPLRAVLASCLGGLSLVHGAVADEAPLLDRLDTLTVEQGLSHGTIWALTQDPQGFLWIGTPEGLDRYDGFELRAHQHDRDDPDSLVENGVRNLEVDGEGRLWVGTSSGLDRYDHRLERFVHYPHDPEDPGSPASDGVLDLFVDREGLLWLASMGGLDRYDPLTDSFVRVWPSPPPTERTEGATEADEGAAGEGTEAEADGGAGEETQEAEEESNLAEVTSWVSAVTQLRDGAMLFATAGQVRRLEPGGQTPTSLDLGQSLTNSVWDLFEDRDGRIWISVALQGVRRYDPGSGRVEVFRHDPEDPASLGADRVPGFLEDRQGRLWVATHNGGLNLFDGVGFRRYTHDADVPSGLPENSVTTFFEDRHGILWLGGYVGLSSFDPSREQFQVLRAKPGDPASLVEDSVWAVAEDQRGELWVGSYSRGVTRFDPSRRQATHYRPDPGDPEALQDGVVSAVVEDLEGRLWISTWGGLHRFDRERERFAVYRHDSDDPTSLSDNEIYNMIVGRDGALWLGTLGGGLERFDPTTETFRHHFADDERDDSLCSNVVRIVYQGSDGTLWLGTDDGLARRDPGAGDVFRCYRHDAEVATSLGGNAIEAIWQTDADTLWVGSRGEGLYRMTISDERFSRVRPEDSDWDTVMAIQGDRRGRLWLPTERGLVRFDPSSETFQPFGTDDGLPAAQFTYVSSHQSPSGELFFGTSRGLVAFDPETLVDDPHPPPVALTELLLFNEPVPLRRDDPDSPLEHTLGATDQLVLTHRDSVVGFEFAALHLASPRANRYAYQLEGLDRGWVHTGSDRRFAQYSNLAAGDYVFRVKASNADGVWNETGAAVAITVLPAPWRTAWAYALYTALVLGAFAWYLRAQRQKVERERAISRRLREINHLKDQFLANTSHELRTPLYGIIGLAESMVDGASGELPPTAKGHLGSIVASGKRLSSLVNDILDYSRMTGKGLRLRRSAVDLKALTDVVLTLTEPLVGSKRLELINAVDPGLAKVDADEARLQQILLNLVGNAVKFTEEGSVEVSAERDGARVVVRVRDTGIGIPVDQQQRIFEAFEQADASTEREFGGTGLGLAVTKQLVGFHGGSLGVESVPGEGSLFYFTLPQAGFEDESGVIAPPVLRDLEARPVGADPREEGRAPESAPEGVPETAAVGEESIVELPEEQLTVLVVDDEPVNRLVLENQLRTRGYRVVEASSGEEALRRVAEEAVPDLVLLDVMMPKMSGYEVCRRLRERFPPHELPIIFLTAKNQPHDLVTGFKQGANDYLTKPVAKSELLARVRSHLEILYVHRNLERLVEERSAQLKVLGGLLPICGECKSIRDDQGYWRELETFLDENSEATFTHGLCPDCATRFYDQLAANPRLPSSRS